MKKLKPVEIGLVAAILIAHGIGACMPADTVVRWFTIDDAYYYFTVARNIVGGNGMTFDGIGVTNGFHPLWMLVCLPVFAIFKSNLILPLRMLIIVLGLFNAATSVIVYRLLARVVSAPMAALGGLAWAFLPAIHTVTSQGGLEGGINAFFLAGLVYKVSKLADEEQVAPWQAAAAGVLGALAFLSRLDNIFVVTMLGLWLVFRRTPARYYLLIDILSTCLAVLAGFIARLGLGPELYQYSRSALVMIAIASAAHIALNFTFGLYSKPASRSLPQTAIRAALSSLASTPVIAILMFAGQFAGIIEGFPRAALLLEAAISFLLLLGSRAILSLFFIENSAPEPPRETLQRKWKAWMRDALMYFGILAVTLIGFMLWSHTAADTWLPVSGQIKEWWGTLPDNFYGDPPDNIAAFFGLDPEARWAPWYRVLAVLTPVGTVPFRYLGFWLLFYTGVALIILRLGKATGARQLDRLAALPLLIGGTVQLWTYNIRAYIGFREWYWIAQLLFLVLVAVVLFESLLRLIAKNTVPMHAWMITAAILGTLILTQYALSSRLMYRVRIPDEQKSEYLIDVHRLESLTEPGARIGMTGGGDTSYFIADRTIVNMDGLISQPQYFDALKRQQGVKYFAEIGLDYVFISDGMLNTDPYWMFKNHIELVQKFGTIGLYRFVP